MSHFFAAVLVFLLALATGCGGDDDCGPSTCGRCAPGCTNADRCVDGEWVCECDCASDAATDAPVPACIAGGTTGCGADAPCCAPYGCVDGYCCGGSPPGPHWDCL